MTGILLKEPDQKEALSRIHVQALAGYLTSVPMPDRDSVDLRIPKMTFKDSGCQSRTTVIFALIHKYPGYS